MLYVNGLGIGLEVNTWALPLEATINLFINWLLGLTLISGFNQAIMVFNRPLWA